MAGANFEIVEETEEYILIRDIGPWDVYKTVTNDVENVIGRLLARGTLKEHDCRRLIYLDSEGDPAEIVLWGNSFQTFMPIVADDPLFHLHRR